MHELPNKLLLNVSTNLLNLKSDFIGVSINPGGVIHVLTSIVLTLLLLLTYYLSGNKIRRFLLKTSVNSRLSIFVDISLGYIFIGTGLLILGVLSLLYPAFIITYLLLIVCIAMFPLKGLSRELKYLYHSVDHTLKLLLKHRMLTVGIFCFVIIGLLRLLLPETGEDAVGYHTDLPNLYLNTHTMIIPSKEPQHVIPYPQLGEMSYILPILFGLKDTTRYIHFSFYLLVVSFMVYIANQKNYSFAKLAVIVFVTAPVVIRINSSANVDFHFMLCFALSLFILQSERKKLDYKTSLVSGIILGGALATKLWLIAYIPALVVWIFILFRHKINKNLLKFILIFFLSAFFISSLWQVRAFLITGNPIFPFFSVAESLEIVNSAHLGISSYLGFNKSLFDIPNLIVYSPLFFLGILFFVLNFNQVLKLVGNSAFFIIFILLFSEHLFVKIYLGRHLLGLYSIAVLIISAACVVALSKHVINKSVFIGVFSILFIYYALNTIINLPYGLGWADQNKYLTRILSKDNSSYYDFDHKFGKLIKSNDLVATYGIYGFYYANFSYIDIAYIFDKKHRSLRYLKEKGVTKLLLKNEGLKSFCRKLDLSDCNTTEYKLLLNYPFPIRNLYSIPN